MKNVGPKRIRLYKIWKREDNRRHEFELRCVVLKLVDDMLGSFEFDTPEHSMRRPALAMATLLFYLHPLCRRQMPRSAERLFGVFRSRLLAMERGGVEKPCELLEVLLEKAQDLRNFPQLHGGHAAYDTSEYLFKVTELIACCGQGLSIRYDRLKKVQFLSNTRIVESEVYKKDFQAGLHVSSFQLKVVKWLLACLVGLLTGIIGFAINLAVENISAFKFLKTSEYMENRRLDIACAILVASNLALVLTSGLLCTYIAPAAAGSGIPDVKAYLNGVNIPDILAPKTFFVKVYLHWPVNIWDHRICGRGPFYRQARAAGSYRSLHSAFLNQGGFKYYHVSWRWLRYVQNDRDQQDLVTCGAAAGVAAAFRAPVGGVLFAVEEVASWWKSSLLWRAFFTPAMVAIVLRTASNFCSAHSCGLYGSGGLIMYNMGSVVIEFGLEDLMSVIMLGLIGVMGSALTYASGKIVLVYNGWHRRYGSAAKMLHSIAISLITSTCAIGIPWMSSCTACPSDSDEKCPTAGSYGNFKHFISPDGYYNDLASLFFNTACFSTRMRMFPVVTFNGTERVKMILNVLKTSSHNAFPILQVNASAETPYFHCLITRQQLIMVLMGRRFFVSESFLEESFILENYGKPEACASGKMNDLEYTLKEQQMFVDLYPYANTLSFTVVDSTSLSKAYSLFRGLGLRHLCIVPKIPNGSPVLGILARHNFMPEHIFSLFPHLQSKRWRKMHLQRFYTRSVLKCRKLWSTFVY
ncbi:hypothetical protein L7F22_059141 [Adiantum nelumboides]|nr:hypothetical protein [Adiantum nelumboides]